MTQRDTWRNLLPIVTLLMLVLSACGLVGPAPSSEPTTCDGIGSTVGGCDADRPVFNGTTCEDIALELGAQLNDQLLAIVNGPDDPEESKATRVRHRESVAVSLANNYLREEGLIRECAADQFLETAEQEFSDEFRAVMGGYISDGPPGTYEEWRQQLRAYLEMIDVDESASDPSPRRA